MCWERVCTRGFQKKALDSLSWSYSYEPPNMGNGELNVGPLKEHYTFVISPAFLFFFLAFRGGGTLACTCVCTCVCVCLSIEHLWRSAGHSFHHVESKDRTQDVRVRWQVTLPSETSHWLGFPNFSKLCGYSASVHSPHFDPSHSSSRVVFHRLVLSAKAIAGSSQFR